MYVGKLVESAEATELLHASEHPYTEALMSAVPIHNPRLRDSERRIRLKGEIADPANPPTGCYFHPRAATPRNPCAYRACAASARKRTFRRRAICRGTQFAVAQLLKLLLKPSERQSTLTGQSHSKRPTCGTAATTILSSAARMWPRIPPDAKGRRFRGNVASLAGSLQTCPEDKSRSIGSMKSGRFYTRTASKRSWQRPAPPSQPGVTGLSNSATLR